MASLTFFAVAPSKRRLSSSGDTLLLSPRLWELWTLLMRSFTDPLPLFVLLLFFCNLLQTNYITSYFLLRIWLMLTDSTCNQA